MLLRRTFETAVSRAADLAWRVCIRAGRGRRAGSFQPPWASRPLLRSWEKTSPELGWPRTTDSLCPVCVKEARARILSGENDADILRTSHVGEIKATILERDGRILIEKHCPTHGTFTDTLAVNPEFQQRMEGLFPGRDLSLIHI